MARIQPGFERPGGTGTRIDARRPAPAVMLERLRNAPDGADAGGESGHAEALYLNPERAAIDRDRFSEYDAAIAETGRRLRMTPEHGRRWKPHQWLALLFAEHYLRRYFEDSEGLRAALNAEKKRDAQTARMPDYTAEDLRTVAVQSATGSGKTLVMRAHILQYRCIAGGAGRPPRNVILAMPHDTGPPVRYRHGHPEGAP